MREFCAPADFTILIAKTATDFKVFTLGDLLPESFGPEALGK